MNKPALLNNRFEVLPDLNLVKDKVSQNQVRLEPRLMQLLGLLMENEGQLVTRETITSRVWDNYGNADEGLTQAISYLRKVLDDNEKKLIETIPKKGYVLHGKLEGLQVKVADDPLNVSSISKRRNEKLFVVIGLIVCLIIAAVFLLSTREDKNGSQSPDVLPGSSDAPINYESDSPPGRGADVYYDSSDVKGRDSAR